MRNLTEEELSLVAGGWGWWDEMASFFKNIFDSIFSSRSNTNTPTISEATYRDFMNHCARTGGRNSIEVVHGEAAGNVKVFSADGSYTRLSLRCNGL